MVMAKPAGTAGSDWRLLSASSAKEAAGSAPALAPLAEEALTRAEADTIWGTVKSYLLGG